MKTGRFVLCDQAACNFFTGLKWNIEGAYFGHSQYESAAWHFESFVEAQAVLAVLVHSSPACRLRVNEVIPNVGYTLKEVSCAP